MELTLNISDETVGILLNIGAQMKLPEVLSTPEALELVIDALANSVDTQMEVANLSDSKPIEMQAAIDAILNPDISTGYTAPEEQDAPKEKPKLTFEQVIEMGGNHGKEIDDPLTRIASTMVHNQLDQDMWNTRKADELVTQTLQFLTKKINNGESI
jgi:hypothetical protein